MNVNVKVMSGNLYLLKMGKDDTGLMERAGKKMHHTCSSYEGLRLVFIGNRVGVNLVRSLRT